MDDTALSLTEKQRRVLELGRAYLGVLNGHIQRRLPDEPATEVVISVGEDPDLLPAGTVIERGSTYCRRVVQEESPLALSNAPEQGWAEDPAYAEHGIDCYLGTTIFVGGETYGTVCFVSSAAREADFTAEEKAFIELIARLLGRELEATEHEQDLAEQTDKRTQLTGKYEALLELAPEAIIIADSDTGEIVELNEKATELTGYAADELRGLRVVDLHPEEHRAQYSQLLTDGFDDNPLDAFEDGTALEIQRADGSTVPIEMSLGTVAVDGQLLLQEIIRDISDRRAREEDLCVKNQAIEESAVGITIGDGTDPELPIIYANDGFERLTGYKKYQAMGRNCRFLQGEATDEETVGKIRGAIAAEESIRTQILNYRANGTPFWNRLTVAPVTGDDDEVNHFVGIQEDITGRKRRDRLIEVMDRVLRHNLRNDMNVVKGFAGMIGEQTDGEIARMAGRIEKTASGLTDLSEKAQAFEAAVRESDTLEKRDIVSEVREVVTRLRREYPDTEFGIDAHTSGPVLTTDRLQLALRELGENAAEHGGSPVLYRIEIDDDDRLVVRIQDRGPGLPQLERTVLEVGRETPLEHGLGLGLWLVNWIVTGIGGEVSASVDGGTTVTVRLPPAADGVATDGVDSHRQAAISTERDA